MPTPCLNTFSHSGAYIIWKCFFCLNLSLFLWIYFCPWRQTSLRSRCHQITRMNSTRFSRLWRKQAQKLTPDGENRSLWRSSASFPGGKSLLRKGRESMDETSSHCSATCATFAHAHNNLKWRPIPRQLLECPVFRLMRAAEVTNNSVVSWTCALKSAADSWQNHSDYLKKCWDRPSEERRKKERRWTIWQFC